MSRYDIVLRHGHDIQAEALHLKLLLGTLTMRKRFNVNKRRSSRSFNRRAGKTAHANLMVARGGYRL